MKFRKILSFTTIGFVIILIGIFMFWKSYSVEDRLKEYILSEVQPYFEGKLKIDKLYLSPKSISLKRVSLELPKQSVQLNIENLKFGFSYYNALKYNFSPIRIISDVVLEKPVFRIKRNPTKDPNSKSEQPKIDLENLKQTYENTLLDINFIGKLVIKEGSVVWVNSLNEEISLISNLEGWISTKDMSKSVVRLSGRLFASRNENVILEGQANLLAGRIDSVSVSLWDNHLSTSIPSIYPKILKIEKGKLMGRGVLKEKPNGSLTLDGEISITDADLTLFQGKLKLDYFNSKVKINDWNLELISCNFNCYDSHFEIAGNIYNIFHPEFDLTVQSNQTNLEKVYNEIWGGKTTIGLKGLADFDVHVTNTTQNPIFSGSIDLANFEIFGEKFTSVETYFNYSSGKFLIEKAKGFYHNLFLDSKGVISIEPENPTLSMDIKVSGDLTKIEKVAQKLNKELVTLPFNVNGHFESDFKKYSFFSDIQISGVTLDSSQIPVIEGKLNFYDDNFELIVDCDENPFKLDVKVKLNNHSPQFFVKFENFGGNLWEIANIPLHHHLKKLLLLSGEVTGDRNYSTYTLNANRTIYTGESNLLFKIDGVFSSSDENTQIQGDISYHSDTGGNIPGYLDLEIGPEYLNVKQYQLGDFYFANGRLELSGDRKIEGKLELKNADIIYILDGVLLNPSFDVLGQINGEINLSGSVDAPIVDSDLRFSDIIFKGEGYYSGEALLNLVRNKLTIERLNLFKEDNPLFEATGTIDLKKQMLDVKVKGTDTDISTVLNLILKDFDYLKGSGDFDLTIRDSFKQPEINGEITARDGWLFFIPYDTLKMKIGKFPNLIASNGNYLSTNGSKSENDSTLAGLYIQNATIQKNEKFTITGTGYLPFTSELDMDIRLNGEGDALAILFSDMPEVLETESEAKFKWEFGGSYSNPVYTEGEVLLKNGKVKLKSIAQVVENIEATVKLNPVNQFVSVTNLSGTIKKHSFYAFTKFDSLNYNNNSNPLFITEWGLNFGTIYFKSDETDQKGVPLNIPGAMKPDENGWFVVKGKDNKEYFTISGPEEHPVATGEIFVSNAAFTFPFEFEEPIPLEPSLTEKILDSMVWDVHLVPVKDVRYVKQLPGFFDNIWINATIDPISDLHFTGIFEDDTFRSEGVLQSTRGTIEYLDFNFGIEKFAAEFDKNDIFPIVYGRARTTFTDSLGIPSNIYLTMYLYDPETKQELEKGRWDEDVRFRLSSDNPNIVGSNEIQVLASLGYSVQSFPDKAKDVIGISTDNLIFRPLFRPVERKLEQTLGLDVIRFRSSFAKNIIFLNSNAYSKIDTRHRRYLLFRSTQLTVGKYLSKNVFLLYSGQLEVGLDPIYQRDGLGLRHSLDLEYRIYPNLLLELQYNYDRLLLTERDDKRIQIRHFFEF